MALDRARRWRQIGSILFLWAALSHPSLAKIYARTDRATARANQFLSLGDHAIRPLRVGRQQTLRASHNRTLRITRSGPLVYRIRFDRAVTAVGVNLRGESGSGGLKADLRVFGRDGRQRLLLGPGGPRKVWSNRSARPTLFIGAQNSGATIQTVTLTTSRPARITGISVYDKELLAMPPRPGRPERSILASETPPTRNPPQAAEGSPPQAAEGSPPQAAGEPPPASPAPESLSIEPPSAPPGEPIQPPATPPAETAPPSAPETVVTGPGGRTLDGIVPGLLVTWLVVHPRNDSGGPTWHVVPEPPPDTPQNPPGTPPEPPVVPQGYTPDPPSTDPPTAYPATPPGSLPPTGTPVVPEPRSWGLLLAGLVPLWWMRRSGSALKSRSIEEERG